MTTSAWEHDEVLHGYWVEPGRILAGEYPGDLDRAETIRKIRLLVENGIRTFVDLTQVVDGLEPYEDVVAEVARERGVDLVRISHPIPDMSVIDHDGYDAIVDTVREASVRGGVYIHCWGGIGRTATVVGCLFVDDGHTADTALARIDELRSVTRKAHRPAPQARSQIERVREREQRRRVPRPVPVTGGRCHTGDRTATNSS